MPEVATDLGSAAMVLSKSHVLRRRGGVCARIESGPGSRDHCKDLREIRAYIAKDSKRYARFQVERIQDTAARTLRFPKIGRPVPEFPEEEWRELLAGNYRIVYSGDKPVVKKIACRLEDEYGLSVWLDEWNLVPGDLWQEGLEKALDESRSCVLFLGPNGLGPWQNEEKVRWRRG